MSTTSAIADVTETLEDLLRDGQQPAGLFDVTLDSPADETAAATPKVNLFLFRVQEHAFARNQEWQPTSTASLQYPPLALTLLYLLTPFASGALDEHRVLGEAMRVLHDNSIVKGAQLRGSLADTPEELKVDLCPFDLEELTKIWNAFNKPYRLSVAYLVRVVQLDSTVERRVGRVIEKVDNFYQLP